MNIIIPGWQVRRIWRYLALLTAYGRVNRGNSFSIGRSRIADADRLAEPLSVSEMQGLPSHREGEKFFEHVAGAGRIEGGTAMTTYYESGTFGGALTIGPADEFVNLHGSGVMIDIFGTAISSMLVDGFETVESGGLDSGSTLDVELTVRSGGTVIGATVDTIDYWNAGEAIGVTLVSGSVETISSGGVALGTTVSNSTVVVSSGGLDSGSTLVDGFETVESGGLDSGSTIDVELNVMSGATVIGLTVDTFVYRNAGEAIGVTLESGTVETISSGGVALGTTVSNSTLFISSGGLVSGATLYGRGVETVYSGGEASAPRSRAARRWSFGKPPSQAGTPSPAAGPCAS